MMWECSHYLLFVQAVSLFLLDSFALAQTEKVLELFSLLVFGDLDTASQVSAINTAQHLQRVQTEWCLEYLAAWVQLQCMSCPLKSKMALNCSLFVFSFCVWVSFPNKRVRSSAKLLRPESSLEGWKSEEWYSVIHLSWPSCLFYFPYLQGGADKKLALLALCS